MDKRDGMVLAAILIGVGIPVTLMFLVAVRGLSVLRSNRQDYSTS